MNAVLRLSFKSQSPTTVLRLSFKSQSPTAVLHVNVCLVRFKKTSLMIILKKILFMYFFLDVNYFGIKLGQNRKLICPYFWQGLSLGRESTYCRK